MFDVSSLGVIAALLAGTISFVSPCVLPLVPGYVSYIAGRTGPTGAERSRRQAVWLSFCFVLGFSTIFMALGASATALGQALLRWRFELNLIGGAVVILFGLFMLGPCAFKQWNVTYGSTSTFQAGSRWRPMCWASPSVLAGPPVLDRSSAQS